MTAPLYLLLGVGVIMWLAGLAACGLAIRWSIRQVPGRRWAALVLSLIAAGIGYFELSHFQFSYSKTVNGRTWGIQSKWFFIVLCVLGAISLVVALLGFARSRPLPKPGTSPGNSEVTKAPPQVS